VAKRAVYPGCSIRETVRGRHPAQLQIFDELNRRGGGQSSKQPLFSVKERLEMIDEATRS